MATSSRIEPTRPARRYRLAMRVVVSGTHGTGKSTLVADLVERHPGFRVLGDPADELAGDAAEASTDLVLAQFAVAVRRLQRLRPGTDAVCERGPLDYLAYLRALHELGRDRHARALSADALEEAAAAMEHVDLVVLLVTEAATDASLGADEDPELRDAMQEALLELHDDPDLIGASTRVVELAGSPERRLRALGELLG